MTDIRENPPVTQNSTRPDWPQAERTTLLITYILYALGCFSFLPALAGVIINHIKLAESRNEIIRSHHRWLMRTFWFALLWSFVCLLLMLVFVGFIGYLILGIWCVYRIIRGIIAFAEYRPTPLAGN